MPLGHQIVLRQLGNRVLAPDGPTRRVLVATLLEQPPNFELLGFGVGGDHAHVLSRAPAPVVIELGRRLMITLQARLPRLERFRPPLMTPITDADHLRRLVDYVIDQDRRHAVFLDPLREATCLPDLLGLRSAGAALVRRVMQELPQLRGRELVGHLPAPLNGQVHLATLAEAAAAALAVPEVRSNQPSAVRARRAAVAPAEGVDPAAVAEALGVDARSVRRLTARPVPASEALAVRRWSGLLAAVAASPPRDPLT